MNRLLVVDDEESNRDMLSRRLERSGFSVAVADSGAAALQIIGESTVDLVLLDSMMPGMTGLEVLKLLRAVRSPAELPVIMVTAVCESQRIAEALDSGANDYVTKPVDYPVALARIRSQLSRTQTEKALRQSEERYALAARGANDGLWDWDLEASKIAYSTRWKAMLGHEEAEISSSPEEWLSRIHPADKGGFTSALELHWKEGLVPFEREHRMRHKNGSYRWMLSRGLAVRNAEGALVRMAGSQTDITEKKTLDELTGLPNRLLFTDRLVAMLERSRLEPSSSLAVLFIDLDRFKLINDSLGHLAGDHVLAETARRLKSVVRGGVRDEQTASLSTVARLSGDEFAVLLDGVTTAEAADSIAERILKALRAAIPLEGREVFVTASIGISFSSPEYSSPEEMLRDADTAMYCAKGRGRSQWAVFDRAMRDRATARLQVETDLQGAVARGELSLHYQPLVSLASGSICGFEALVRWNHPRRGLIPPMEFMPLAEESDLISEIGLWVLETACRQMRRWQESYPQDPPLEISVNFSPRQFQDPQVVNEVERVLGETGLAAGSLRLEITEGMLLNDLRDTLSALKKMRDLGVGFKIDDFGTGYSSLKYLCRFPFDDLKIDRSIILTLNDEKGSSQEIVRAVLAMARNLGMGVVAEGVEKIEQVDRLRSMGCEFAQGYYFSRPVTAQAAEDLLSEGAGGTGEGGKRSESA